MGGCDGTRALGRRWTKPPKALGSQLRDPDPSRLGIWGSGSDWLANCLESSTQKFAYPNELLVKVK